MVKRKKYHYINLEIKQYRPGSFKDEALVSIAGDDPYHENWIGFVKNQNIFSRLNKQFTKAKVIDEDDEFLYAEPDGDPIQNRLVKISKDKLIKAI